MSFVNFNVAAAYVGAPGATLSPAFESLATQTLQGVQTANLALVYPRQDHYNWDGGGGDVMVERPQAELSLSMAFASGVNERLIGFVTSPSGTIPALSAFNAERNYYVSANMAGQDAVGYGGTDSYVLAIGNAVLTHYDFSAGVGQVATSNITLQGLNALVQRSGVNQILPAVYKQSGTSPTGLWTLPPAATLATNYFAAGPAAMRLTFNTGCAIGAVLSGNSSCPVDSFSFALDMPRVDVKDLGWAYPNERPISWPVVVNIHADATLNAFQTDALNRFTCADSGHSFNVTFASSCGGGLEDFAFQFEGAKLENQTFEVGVAGGQARVSFDWSVKIYDINRTARGCPNFYINASGTPYTSIIFPQVDYVSGSAPLTFNLSTGCFLTLLSGPGLLSGNSVFVTDEASVVVVRAAATDGSDTRDVTVTVG